MQYLVCMWMKEGTLLMTSNLKVVMILKEMMCAMIGWRHSVIITLRTNSMGLFVTCLKWMKNAWAFFSEYFHCHDDYLQTV